MESKCPCCGSEMSETYLGWVCMNTSLENPCSFRIAKERLPRIAAAMELARATRLLEDAMEPLNSGKLKMGEALPRIKLAMEHEKGCEKRVLEVFGGE